MGWIRKRSTAGSPCGPSSRRAWLLTAHPSSIGPARRAQLGVIHIGPRTVDVPASVERADRRARDLLDAVSQLLTMDTFERPPDRPDRIRRAVAMRP